MKKISLFSCLFFSSFLLGNYTLAQEARKITLTPEILQNQLNSKHKSFKDKLIKESTANLVITDVLDPKAAENLFASNAGLQYSNCKLEQDVAYLPLKEFSIVEAMDNPNRAEIRKLILESAPSDAIPLIVFYDFSTEQGTNYSEEVKVISSFEQVKRSLLNKKKQQESMGYVVKGLNVDFDQIKDGFGVSKEEVLDFALNTLQIPKEKVFSRSKSELNGNAIGFLTERVTELKTDFNTYVAYVRLHCEPVYKSAPESNPEPQNNPKTHSEFFLMDWYGKMDENNRLVSVKSGLKDLSTRFMGLPNKAHPDQATGLADHPLYQPIFNELREVEGNQDYQDLRQAIEEESGCSVAVKVQLQRGTFELGSREHFGFGADIYLLGTVVDPYNHARIPLKWGRQVEPFHLKTIRKPIETFVNEGDKQKTLVQPSIFEHKDQFLFAMKSLLSEVRKSKIHCVSHPDVQKIISDGGDF